VGKHELLPARIELLKVILPPPAIEKTKEGAYGCLTIAFACIVSYARCMELLTHDELVRLTPPERLALIAQLWDSLQDNHLPLTAAQQGELDRRLLTLDEDRRKGVTWTALKTELELRCP
jgi:putative addiction module component (TIGR02574 family)